MNYEIVNLERKTVQGLTKRTTNENGQAASDIGTLWQHYITGGYPVQMTNAKNEKAIGLYMNYESDYTKPYTFMCGKEIVDDGTSVSEDVTNFIIPAGKYAKFTIKGHMQQAVAEAWAQIWKMHLNRTYVADFEEYHNDSQDINNQTIDIYIGIK